MLSEPTAAPTPLTATSAPHPHRRPSVRLAVALAALALVVSGCGLFSSDDDDASSSTTVAGVAPPGPDDGAAGSAMLTIEDFPAGWTSARLNTAIGSAILTSIPACGDVSAALSTAESTSTGSAAALSFTSGEERFDLRVQMYEDDAAATAALTGLKDADPEGCESAVIASLAEAFALSDTAVESTYETDTGVGTANAIITITGERDDGPVTFERAWIQEGRALISIYAVLPSGSTIDAAAMTQTAVERVSSVVGA